MSQYSSPHHIITNVQHLGNLRNIKHTDLPRTNKNNKGKNIEMYV